ncbi:MAG: potassium channel family protein [Bacteroidota bacterium]|nr:potassium channel family protein [Bacteroidota bacterium]
MFIFTGIISFLKDKSYRNSLFTTNFFIVLVTIVYHYIEGWSWLDTLYFSLITLTTIGYGDFSPQTDFGKIFTLLYIVIGVALILGFFNSLMLHFNKK